MKLRKSILMFLLSLTLVTFPCCQKTKYKVSFMTNGGSAIDVVETTGTISEPEAPTRAGYTFAGWYTDASYSKKFDFATSLTSSTTLFARWRAQTYTIKYNVGVEGENSNLNPLNPTSYTALQNDIRLVNPTCLVEGKFFGGWYMDEALNYKILVIKSDSAKNYNLYAKWSDEEQAVDYAIIYNLDGGTNGNNPSVFNKNDSKINLLPATKEGYDFMGWFKDSSFTTSITQIDTSVEADYTLYAKFEQKSVGPTVPMYTITYNLNGGTNGSNPVRYTEDMGTITLQNPTKLSCLFKGWYTDEEFTQPITTIDCSQKKAVSVYAKWINGLTETCYDFDLGIGKDYVIYHVSDTHINACLTDSDINLEKDRISSRYSYAKSFGEKYSTKNLYSTSAENFKAIINYLNDEAPDAVCFTGDLMDYYSTGNYNFINTELVKCNAPFTYALGNHEDPSSTCATIAGIADTSFQVLDLGDFEIITIDNTCKDDDENCSYSEEQYEALVNEINKGKPIIITEHIPIITKDNCNSRIEQCGSYFFIDENACSTTTKKVIDLMVNSDNVKMLRHSIIIQLKSKQ